MCKVKVKMSLYITKQHAMKTNGGMEVQLHGFLISVLGGVEWSDLRSDHFILGEKYPLYRRLSGVQSPSGRGGEEKNPCPNRDSKLYSSTLSVVTKLTELSGLYLKWILFNINGARPCDL